MWVPKMPEVQNGLRQPASGLSVGSTPDIGFEPGSVDVTGCAGAGCAGFVGSVGVAGPEAVTGAGVTGSGGFAGEPALQNISSTVWFLSMHSGRELAIVSSTV